MASIPSLTIGTSAMKAFEKGIQTVSDNIANINSYGFKSARTEYAPNFSEVLQQSHSASATGGISSRPALQVGTGTKVSGTTTLFSQGALNPTSLASDLAVASESGFFRVKDPISDLDFATRAGNFRRDDQNYLVTPDGFRVQGLIGGYIVYSATFDATTNKLDFTKTSTVEPTTIGDITLNLNLSVGGTPATIINNTGAAINPDTGNPYTNAEIEAAAPRLNNYEIDQSGFVKIQMSSGDTFNLGQVLLVDFADRQALIKEQNGLFSGFESAAIIGGVNGFSANLNTPGTNGLGTIKSRTLELSNTKLTDEFAEMISTQRNFQAAARIITVSDEMLNEVVNLKR